MAQDPMDQDLTTDLPASVYAQLREAGHFSTTPAALARLVVADSAAELADAAERLVATDRTARPGELTASVHELAGAVRELLAQAVIADRARGATWEQIGEALGGVSRQAAQDAHRVALAHWETGLDVPYVRSRRGGVLNPNLPDAALSPANAGARLDRWLAGRARAGQPARTASAVLHPSPADRALGLSGAVLAAARRVTETIRRRGANPVAEHVLAERKVAAFEAMLIAKPGDSETIATLTDARAKLAALTHTVD